jgi:hypothetical protein
MKVGRCAVEDARGLPGAVKEEEGRNCGDVAEGLGGKGVGDGPVQAGAERAGGGTDLVFGGFDSQGEDGDVLAVLALELAKPFESGAARRAPSGPELDEDDASRQLFRLERLAGKIGKLHLGEGGDLLGSGGSDGVFTSYDVFLACKDQVNHANQIGFEFSLAGGAAPRSVAARAFDFPEVSEFARRGDQDIVHEDGGIALDAKSFSELGGSKVFGDERHSSGVFGGDFLDQQTCWVRDISSVGPADECDVHGFARGLLER